VRGAGPGDVSSDSEGVHQCPSAAGGQGFGVPGVVGLIAVLSHPPGRPLAAYRDGLVLVIAFFIAAGVVSAGLLASRPAASRTQITPSGRGQDELAELISAIRSAIMSKMDNKPPPDRSPYLLSPILFPAGEPSQHRTGRQAGHRQ
jgi:hypothetical protein